MTNHRWRPTWRMQFWLALPLLAIAFWVCSALLTQQVLSRSYSTENKLQADTQLEIKVSIAVATIKATLDRTQATTLVEVLTRDSTLKKLEFEFVSTNPHQVEQLIADELGLAIEDVRALVRYEVLR